MDKLITTFKALSDKTRLRIIFSLLGAKRELCICELMDVLKLAQYSISRHMKELKTAGLVQERRAGRFVFYALRKPEDKTHEVLFRILKSFDRKALAADTLRLKNRIGKGKVHCG